MLKWVKIILRNLEVESIQSALRKQLNWTHYKSLISIQIQQKED